MRRIKLLLPLVLALSLAGCVTGASRENAHEFFVLKQDRIAPENWKAFADCLLDGFDRSHFVLTNIQHRQQRRADSIRVESLTAGSILVSADVFEDGRVVLNEANAAGLVNTTGQKETFSRCLAKYKIAK